jgi:hypothetical protein
VEPLLVAIPRWETSLTLGWINGISDEMPPGLVEEPISLGFSGGGGHLDRETPGRPPSPLELLVLPFSTN